MYALPLVYIKQYNFLIIINSLYTLYIYPVYAFISKTSTNFTRPGYGRS